MQILDSLIIQAQQIKTNHRQKFFLLILENGKLKEL